MYKRDTILALKVPKWRKVKDGEPGDWQTEDIESYKPPFANKAGEWETTGELFAYNRARVIGPSPITHPAEKDDPYQGLLRAGVIIEPLTGFSSNVDYPLGYLQEIYTVESVPEDPDPRATVYGIPREYTRVDLSQTGLPSPEEVFARDAPPIPVPEGERPRHAALDPLDIQSVKDARKTYDPLGAKT